MSLYWTDFNLYLQSLGMGSSIGFVVATVQLAGAAAALPASLLSDRLGRRAILAAGALLVCLGTSGFLAGSVPLLFLSAAVFGIGSQSFNVVQTPFMAEHTRSEHRNEYFAAQAATINVTNFIATMIGGRLAGGLASRLALPSSSGPYQVLLVAMVVLLAFALVTMFFLDDDRPGRAGTERKARVPLRRSFGDRALFVRLLIPGFIIAIGAGQVIPYVNVFVKGKFDLDLTSLNDIFALTSLGTAVAMLIQPALARRYGKIGSVVLVQAASIPFIAVLGFSPVLWSVILAMAVRNSLMNAGNPIYNAFAMERLAPAERATYSATASLLWSIGWSLAGPYYSFIQATLGFTAGYSLNFITIVVLYSLGTALQWRWFGRLERPPADETPTVAAPSPAG